MTGAPDFRSDPSQTPKGKGIAHGRRADFWRSQSDKVIEKLSQESPYRSFDELPAMVRNKLTTAVVEDAELIGFWAAWHQAGGFASLEMAGWHRATIYRKIRRFRARFGAHPDEYRFSWINLDLERAWSEDIEDFLQTATRPEAG